MTFGGVLIASAFLFDPATLAVRRLDDLVWIYKAGAAAYVADREGVVLQLGAGERDADRLLAFLERRLPWVLVGYDVERNACFRGPRRADPIADVDDRRANLRRVAV